MERIQTNPLTGWLSCSNPDSQGGFSMTSLLLPHLKPTILRGHCVVL